MTADLTVSAKFDRRLAWSGGGSVRYLVTEISATRDDISSNAVTERAPLNIALVIDASGSMRGSRLDAAKRAALGVLDTLNELDRLTVVSFSSDVQVHVDGVAVTSEAKRTARDAILSLSTRGMTNLSEGWFAGVDCASRVAEEDQALMPRVTILSDGRANQGIRNPRDLAEHAGELRRRNVITSTLGIGDGYDEVLLQTLAEHGGGRLHDAELSEEIESVLFGEIGEASEALIEGASVILKIPDGFTVDVVGLNSVKKQPGELRVELGALRSQVSRHVVFKATCPNGLPGVQFSFSVSVEGRDVLTGQELNAHSARVTLEMESELPNRSQPRDLDVSLRVAKAWYADMVRRVAELNRDRAYRNAETYLREELALFEKFVGDLRTASDMVRELNMLLDRIDHRWSERTRKEMVLHSALASRSGTDHRGAGKMSWAERLMRE